MDDVLRSSLAGAGFPTHVATLGQDSEVLILPHGGRVLGLFAKGDPRNFLWTNPRLQAEVSAREFLVSEEWHNTGGDRAWIAPEIDFFLPAYPDTSVYVQPRSLDPGSYGLDLSGASPALRMEFEVTPRRGNLPLHLRLSKSVEAAANPRPPVPGVLFAGYTLRTSLEIMNGHDATVGLWSLLQMPSGGEMILPTHGAPEIRAWFGEEAPADLHLTANAAHYFTGAAGARKLGLRAGSTTGRAGYVYELDSKFHLVVREFSVDTSGLYPDVPWDDPQDDGYAVQICNVNDAMGRFSELEYHTPAIGGPTGKTHREDCSHVLAYRGDRQTIADLATQLLGHGPCGARSARQSAS